MSKFWIKAIFTAVIVTQCGVAHAGWFDGKKKQTNEVKQTVVAGVQKAAENAFTTSPQKTTVAQTPVAAASGASSALTPKASAPSGKAAFYDVGNNGVKSEDERARENAEKDKRRVRLSEDEMEKMKAEMEKLQQGIKTAQDARKVTREISSLAAVKPAAIPEIPKKPELPTYQKAVSSAPAKPGNFKVSQTGVASGYKK